MGRAAFFGRLLVDGCQLVDAQGVAHSLCDVVRGYRVRSGYSP